VEPSTSVTRKLPVAVLMLGFVSFLTDISSEMIFSVLPLFIVGLLGASTMTLGAMEGLADLAASSLDLASGYAADRTHRDKQLATLGYGFSSLAKVALLGAASVTHVFAFRVVERLGKSIRGPPRDALLGSVAPKAHRGLAFGVHKALDKAGAVAGPLVAFALLRASGQTAAGFQRLFVVALVPAFLAVALLAFGVRGAVRAGASRPALKDTFRRAGPRYRRYLVAAALFSLGYLSFAFLLLQANRVGFDAGEVALLYALVNGSFALVSIPIGRLGDRIGRTRIIGASYVLYGLTMIGLSLVQSKPALVGLFLCYGCFYAIDEGQTKAFITDLVPADVRATSIGLYGLVTAVCYLPASLAAGALWKWSGPGWAFGFASVTSLVALAVFRLSAWSETSVISAGEPSHLGTGRGQA
jgi:MFS family permease